MSEANYDLSFAEDVLSDLHAVARIVNFLLSGTTENAKDWRQDG